MLWAGATQAIDSRQTAGLQSARPPRRRTERRDAGVHIRISGCGQFRSSITIKITYSAAAATQPTGNSQCGR